MHYSLLSKGLENRVIAEYVAREGVLNHHDG
jgi:hypothetical protein